jgi:hypothetical protein
MKTSHSSNDFKNIGVTHNGFQVNIMRYGRKVTKYFNGHSVDSYMAAIEHRDQLLSELGACAPRGRKKAANRGRSQTRSVRTSRSPGGKLSHHVEALKSSLGVNGESARIAFRNMRVLPSGLQVTVMRQKAEYSKHFPGHSMETYMEAIAHRDQILRRLSGQAA